VWLTQHSSGIWQCMRKKRWLVIHHIIYLFIQHSISRKCLLSGLLNNIFAFETDQTIYQEMNMNMNLGTSMGGTALKKNNLKARSLQTFRKSKNGFNSKRGKITLKQVFGVKTCLAPAGTNRGTGGGIASNDGGRGGGASPAASGQSRTPMSIGNYGCSSHSDFSVVYGPNMRVQDLSFLGQVNSGAEFSSEGRVERPQDTRTVLLWCFHCP